MKTMRRDPTIRAVQRLQWITIAWMSVEFSVAVVAGIRASSVALTSFGMDSGIELLSASVALWRFHSGQTKEMVSRWIDVALLYALTAYILMSSIPFLLRHNFRPEVSPVGIVILAIAAIIMPWLGHEKRKLAHATGSGSIRADAAQSAVCAYMSWIALIGLALNAAFRFAWADTVAALLLVPLIMYEANVARKGGNCC